MKLKNQISLVPPAGLLLAWLAFILAHSAVQQTAVEVSFPPSNLSKD